ncbi:MAG: hypothetical protein IT473_05560, partial [Lysobacter sp.]|nr:hypothetical protein [Lysobacter sp.]
MSTEIDIDAVFAAIASTLDRVRATAASLRTPELVVFPVRHHSPACAWQLRRLFAELDAAGRAPSAVLIEGPRGFSDLLPLLAREDARLPLAIYTYAVLRKDDETSRDHRGTNAHSDQRRSAYYPFCDYSPELVAIHEAQARGVPARFIDLEFAEQCIVEAEHDRQGDDGGDSLLEERHYRRSRYLQALAERLGCRDHEDLWEHLFEADVGETALDAHLARVSAYCELSRVDCSDEELTADGTLQREAEMAWQIRRALAERAAAGGPVIAVVGGCHAVVLSRLIASDAPRPKIARGAIEESESALIRYSFDRLDRLNGYSAGMTSPAWHQRVWERMRAREKAGLAGGGARLRRDAALETLIDIALTLREEAGVQVPTPTLAAAYEQVLRLCELRQRPAPTREDVLDAVIGCFVKGDADSDGAIVRAVALRALGGTAMGTVPRGASVPPLVRDAQYRLRRQRLKIDDAQPRRAVLDLYRRPEHRVASRLLHGLSLLGVPFAVRTAGPDFVHGVGLERLQEHWEYTYSAATEAALVEAAVHGATVPLAVAQVFNRRLDRAQQDGGVDARTAATSTIQACVLGLHDHLPRALDALRIAIGADSDFGSVAAAVASLALLWESREPLEARQIDALPALLQAAYERALYLGRELRGASGDAGAVLRALTQLRETLLGDAGRALDADLFWRMLHDLQRAHDAAVVRGGALGLRYSAGQADDAELADALNGHLRGMLPAAESVAYLRGLLQTAREAAWQQPALLDALDALLRDWTQGDFVANLPELRLAFAGMTPKETDRIAAVIASR